MSSLLLDLELWDLVVDANGNIAVASEPYSFAQDMACQVRLFQGELYYDQSQGVPYFQDILGQWPAPSVFRTYLTDAALTATGVATANTWFTSWEDRVVGGVINGTSDDGTELPPITFTQFAVAPGVAAY